MGAIFDHVIQYIGYIATFLVILSLTMKSLVRLRILNMLGGILFVIYSLLIGAYPVVFLNGALVLINAYFLFVYPKKDKTNINLLYISAKELENLVFFQANLKDICTFFGNVDVSLCNEIYLLLKNDQIAGIFAGNRKENVFEIIIDFVSAPFRDYKIGKVLFHEHPQLLLERKIHTLIITTNNQIHKDYITKMGFSSKNDTEFMLELG